MVEIHGIYHNLGLLSSTHAHIHSSYLFYTFKNSKRKDHVSLCYKTKQNKKTVHLIKAYVATGEIIVEFDFAKLLDLYIF